MCEHTHEPKDKVEACDHCLHYCSICDRITCCKCGREWGNVWAIPWQPYTPYYHYYHYSDGTGDPFPSPNITICCQD